MTNTVSVSIGDTPSASRPLAGAQRGLWVSQRRHLDAPLQNMAQVCRLGTVDAARLIRAFDSVVRANEILRTRYVEINGTPMVSVVDDIAVTEVVELDLAEVSRWARDRAAQPLDLASTVYDSVVIDHGDDTVSWYLNLHHLVTDATATALVVAQTAAAYDGVEPEPSSFLDWAAGRAKAEPNQRTVAARTHWAARTAPTPLPGFYRPVRRPIAASIR